MVANTAITAFATGLLWCQHIFASYLRCANLVEIHFLVQCNLPIFPLNQSKHSDVVQYFQVLQDMLSEIYVWDDIYPLQEVPPLEKLERTEKVLKGW